MIIRPALAFLAAVSLTAPVFAEEDEQWMAGASAEVASIGYGIPDTDGILFALVCDLAKGTAQLTVYEEIAGAKVGQPITIELKAGAAKAAIKGVASTDQMNGFIYGEAKAVAVEPIVAVLREPGEVMLKMGKASATYPEKGRAEALAQFTETCKVK